VCNAKCVNLFFPPLALHPPHRPPRSSRLEHVHVPFLPLCFGAFPHKVDAADLIEPLGDIGLLELRHVRVERRAGDQRPRRFLGGSVDGSIHVVVACEVERAEEVEQAGGWYERKRWGVGRVGKGDRDGRDGLTGSARTGGQRGIPIQLGFLYYGLYCLP
jgi:hypothetical protein